MTKAIALQYHPAITQLGRTRILTLRLIGAAEELREEGQKDEQA